MSVCSCTLSYDLRRLAARCAIRWIESFAPPGTVNLQSPDLQLMATGEDVSFYRNKFTQQRHQRWLKTPEPAPLPSDIDLTYFIFGWQKCFPAAMDLVPSVLTFMGKFQTLVPKQVYWNKEMMLVKMVIQKIIHVRRNCKKNIHS